jgi:uncharacterized protein (UPF0276 family)
LPLFEAEKIEAIEWSFDTLFDYAEIPAWYSDLLHAFGAEGRLVGHGVFFSLFSGKWLAEQDNWLARLKKLSKEYQFNHITEHFGFMTGQNFHNGAPISIPFTASTLALGIDRLKRIQDVCRCPVGLENLAFSYSIQEVRTQGDFLHQLIEPLNGFIILDLHNLYCQLHNFEVSYEEIIAFYPLERVREIHISGGSWEAVSALPTKKIRRDTHDDTVPKTVFELLKKTIPKCPNLKYVVLEQLSNGLETLESQQAFQSDFVQLEQLIAAATINTLTQNSFLPPSFATLSLPPLEDTVLYSQQQQLSTILETAQTYQHAQQLLQQSSLANSPWQIEHWQPAMLETAVAIAQKWR